MDGALDLKPEVTQGCGFESRIPAGSVHDWGETLEQGTEPPTAPRAPQCRLPTAPLGWVKCREHISLLIILCIIVYVTNKAHLSLICICICICVHREWLRYAKSTSQYSLAFSLKVRDDWGSQVNPLCCHDITRSDRQIGNLHYGYSASTRILVINIVTSEYLPVVSFV